ncbi:MAG: ABC transporter permease [Paramuribaculum sp.]|nr:ABC transporter permease [Paramuribaculum sp.]
MSQSTLSRSLRYGWRSLFSRRIYVVCIIVVPLLFTLFFINMMDEGLPLKVPTAVVDLDQSELSRTVTRNLAAGELTDVSMKLDSYHEAVEAVRSGKIFGFFYIPDDFQQKAFSGQQPTISYYCNLTYFVPGSLAFKGFKTTAVTTTGGLVQTTLVSTGMEDGAVAALIQPVSIVQQQIGNPWTNYNYYLTNSFVPGVIALMVCLVTAYSICEEMKRGTSPEWLRRSGNSMLVAVVGKLMPQAVIEIIVGVGCQAIMYGFFHFPMNCPAWHMILAMVLMVFACQGFALTVCCAVPNLRLAVSICSLVSILAFSIAAFSFPVQQMYGAVGIFSYILPVRYYFLIYVDQALNGIDLYYSRFFYVALLIFPLVGLIGLPRLKKHCKNPVYVP